MKEHIKRVPLPFRMSIPWQQLRNVNWMNKKACPNQAYIPTQVNIYVDFSILIMLISKILISSIHFGRIKTATIYKKYFL